MGQVPSLLLVSSQVRSVHSGVGTYARILLGGLAESGLPITVATWTEEISAEAMPGLGWLDLGSRPRLDPTPGCFWTLGRRLVQRLDGRRFDVVHFLDAREGHAFVRSSHRQGCRVLGTVHDDYAALCGRHPFHYRGRAADPLRRWLFHTWLSNLERSCYLGFDHLMVNSAATAETLKQVYRLDERSMTVVHLTIHPDRDGERTPVELQGDPALLFSGGNFYRKGLDVLLRALPELGSHLPDLRLHVAGKCGSLPKIERLARKLEVGDRLVMHGQVDPARMAAMMEAADLFVMPSRTEALGLVYLEAFAAETPVIAGNRGGVREIVKDRESGLLVPPEDPVALTQAILELREDAGLRAKLIQGGKEILLSRPPARLVKETALAYGPRADEWPTSAPTTCDQPGLAVPESVSG